MLLLPSAPRNISATGTNQQIMLSWIAPNNTWSSPLTYYKIYRGASPGSEIYLNTIGNTNAWTDTSVQNGIRYYYKVSAVTAAGEGLQSNETNMMPIGAPEAPEALIAVPSNAQVNLSWLPPLMNGGLAILGYQIYMGTTMGGEIAAVSISNVTWHVMASLTNGQPYYFKVAAINSAGTGINSSEASATPSTIPTAPQSLAATGELNQSQ